MSPGTEYQTGKRQCVHRLSLGLIGRFCRLVVCSEICDFGILKCGPVRHFNLAQAFETNGYSDCGHSPERTNSLDWRSKVELFEQIRREYEFGDGTITGVANKLKVHRQMVRETIGSALPSRGRRWSDRDGSCQRSSRSSTKCWKRTRKHHTSDLGTNPGRDTGMRGLRAYGSAVRARPEDSWDWWFTKRSCPRAMRGVWKRRWISMSLPPLSTLLSWAFSLFRSPADFPMTRLPFAFFSLAVDQRDAHWGPKNKPVLPTGTRSRRPNPPSLLQTPTSRST